MALLHLMCGKVASGKTYHAKRICEDNNALNFSVDEMMLAIYDSCLGGGHKDAEDKCLNYILKLAVNTVKHGIESVLDYGFWKRHDRESASEYCRSCGIEYIWHYYDTDTATRLEWLAARNVEMAKSPRREYIIDYEMFKRFDSWFEEPSENEFAILRH